jgi:hypothetical protein
MQRLMHRTPPRPASNQGLPTVTLCTENKGTPLSSMALTHMLEKTCVARTALVRPAYSHATVSNLAT